MSNTLGGRLGDVLADVRDALAVAQGADAGPRPLEVRRRLYGAPALSRRSRERANPAVTNEFSRARRDSNP
jgi:hypothetical protein